MHIQLLTTETDHHLFFAKKLQEAACLSSIIVETKIPEFPFNVSHVFETHREEYEKHFLLKGENPKFQDFAETHTFNSLNSKESKTQMMRLKPDVIIVFGTGRLDADVLRIPRLAALNLHGGNPEEYRGLDSHLWAIYHKDFRNLITALHFMSPQIDTGDIVSSMPLPITTHMNLYELRAINTKICVDLSLAAFGMIDCGLPLSRRKQRKRGRYYSAMPAVLKDICVNNFTRLTQVP
jgi:methionyl-tRNA formyltransferase